MKPLALEIIGGLSAVHALALEYIHRLRRKLLTLLRPHRSCLILFRKVFVEIRTAANLDEAGGAFEEIKTHRRATFLGKISYLDTEGSVGTLGEEFVT